MPKNDLTRLNLANAYKHNKSEDSAITEYKKCLQLNPRNNNAYKFLAEIYLHKQMYADAVKQLKKGLSLAPTDNEIKNLLDAASLETISDYSAKALNEFLSGNKKYAYELLGNAIALNTRYTYPRYLLAYFYYTEQKTNEAIAETEKIIELDPGFDLAHKLLGDIYFDSGDYLQAIDKYKLALAINRNDYISYNNISIALVQLERYPEALAYIKKASELAPANLNILYALASIYRDNKMLELALSEYNKLSDYPNVHNDKAGIYTAQGKKREANLEYNRQIEHCNHELSVNPYNAVILNDLANAYIGKEEFYKAEAAINKAINAAPDYRQNYITLANIQKKSGKDAEASKTLKKAYRFPGSPKFININNDISYLKYTPDPNRVIADLDKIYLKNGRVFEGIIKNESTEKVVLEVKIGESAGDMILYNNTIERVIKAKKGR